MSGGVDSSVAAAVLLAQGYDVVGVTMQIWPNESDDDRACCSLSAVEDARRVAAKLGIPHYVLNFQEEFRRAVIDNFISEYRAGRTPNPCIQCNRWIKFDLLLRRAGELGADCVATGHYARTVYHEELGRWSVRRGVDRAKDQSYVLYSLTQEQLPRVLFPLGGMTKPEVRDLAREHGFRVHNKPESQEICFVPDDDYGQFLRRETPEIAAPGPIVDTAGTPRGTHQGVAFYTIGQRRGLGIAANEPTYVVALDPTSNTVVIGAQADLLRHRAAAEDVVFGKFSKEMLAELAPVLASLRYKMHAQPALAHVEDGRLAVTPGQALVCYDGEDVAVGGTIVSE
ncbi:MAG: tRNA-specific 2-thiouridylase MnmA [bacterium ADurb.Bin429]|nr:MAG: tRNA-specific 2-thiouridylase MnmA [bacterium ADurb.Bin429]